MAGFRKFHAMALACPGAPRYDAAMFVFAHLRKCAGTSVVNAASNAGIVLPKRHANGHPARADGHAIPGLAALSQDALARFLADFVSDGVEFMALEWDFPSIEKFPRWPELKFFTIFRDPCERLISNYRYDVVMRYTNAQSLEDYLDETVIWRHGNYYTRFFRGLGAGDLVTHKDVDIIAEHIIARFNYAFFADDLFRFLKDEAGLPILRFGHHNRTNRFAKLALLPVLQISAEDRRMIETANKFDYMLLGLLREAKAARASPA